MEFGPASGRGAFGRMQRPPKPSAEGARQFGNVWASPVAMGVIPPNDPSLQGWRWDQYKGDWERDVDWAYRITLPIAVGGLTAGVADMLGLFAPATGGPGSAQTIDPVLAAQAAGIEGTAPGLLGPTIANLPGAVGVPTAAGLPGAVLPSTPTTAGFPPGTIPNPQGLPTAAGLPGAVLPSTPTMTGFPPGTIPNPQGPPTPTTIPTWKDIAEDGTPPPDSTKSPSGIDWKDVLKAALPALAALAPKLFGPNSQTPGGGMGDGSIYPPELTELLRLAMERMRAQGPLFSAVTEQAYRGLPAYARGEAEEF